LLSPPAREADVGRAIATVFASKPLRRCLDKGLNRRLWNPRQFNVRDLTSSSTLGIGNRSNRNAMFSRAGSVEGIVPTAIDYNHYWTNFRMTFLRSGITFTSNQGFFCIQIALRQLGCGKGKN